MYYHKTGHFPQSQDDLLTGVPNLHFLRSEAVKDPMNKQDGAWRFIYTNASGAIIGSVKYGSMQQMALMDMNGGQMPTAQPAIGLGNLGSQTPSTNNGASASSASGSTAPSTTSTTSTTGSSMTSGFSLGPTNSTATATLGTGAGTVLGPLGQPVTGVAAGPQPTGPVTGPVFGGQLIGVGSTVDATSVRVYKGGKKYNQWEFIWNPIEEQALAMQQGLVSGASPAQPGTGIPGLGLPIAPIGGAAGTTPGGTAPPSGSNNSGGANNSPTSNNPTSPTQ
jgi:hypothetical protein